MTQLSNEPSNFEIVVPRSAPTAAPNTPPNASSPASHVDRIIIEITVITYIIALKTTLLLALKVFFLLIVKEIISAIHFETNIAIKPASPKFFSGVYLNTNHLNGTFPY